MTSRTDLLTYPGEATQDEGFGEVLTQMLLIAIPMFAIASAVSLLALGAT